MKIEKHHTLDSRRFSYAIQWTIRTTKDGRLKELIYNSIEEARKTLIRYQRRFKSLKDNDTIPAIMYRENFYRLVSIYKKA